MKWSVFTLDSNEVEKYLDSIQSLKDLQKSVDILQVKNKTLQMTTEQQEIHQAVG